MDDRPLMQMNASGPGRLGAPMSVEDIARELWQLLDDIDTASDMFKPEQTPFYRYIIGKAKQRHEMAFSDGYTLRLNTR